MATSLLFALLDVENAQGIADAVAANDGSYAARYGQLNPPGRRRVLEALYQAFYTILEARQIGYFTDASTALGEALAIDIQVCFWKSKQPV
jgi:hypothetical protein